jgi:hypothetical protein
MIIPPVPDGKTLIIRRDNIGPEGTSTIYQELDHIQLRSLRRAVVARLFAKSTS